MSTTAVFLDIEKAFDKTWHLGLLYKLSELKFPVNLIKLISGDNLFEIRELSVASQQGHEHETRAIFFVSSHYQAATSEDMKSLLLLQL
jgi:hypothetical protein